MEIGWLMNRFYYAVVITTWKLILAGCHVFFISIAKMNETQKGKRTSQSQWSKSKIVFSQHSNCICEFLGLSWLWFSFSNFGLCRFEIFNETSFDNWVDLAAAPALPASLSLYNELKELGFKIFLLTGRSEFQRNATGANLLSSGYRDWERLILRYINYWFLEI